MSYNSIDDEVLQQLTDAGVIASEIPWGEGEALKLEFASGRTFVLYATYLPGAGSWIGSDEIRE